MDTTKQVQHLVTDLIVESLRRGVIPWRTAWSGSCLPRNLASGKEYRGINGFVLASRGYAQP